jgi:hypothetical protein
MGRRQRLERLPRLLLNTATVASLVFILACALVGWQTTRVPELLNDERQRRFLYRGRELHGWQWAVAKYARESFVIQPPWLIVTLRLSLAFGEWEKRKLARWRLSRGLCPACGYDLRATPDRCPECGTVAAGAPAHGG